jgi:hypothetical protein
VAASTMQARIEGAEVIDGWPDPLPLADELPPVLSLSPAMLPGELSAWVQDIAERMNCPLDLVAIPVMVSAASLLGGRIGIRPQRRTVWLEVGNLWGAVVAPPGSLKSPAAAEALAPLRGLEQRAAEAHQNNLAKYACEEVLYKLQREQVERDAKVKLKDEGPLAAAAALAALSAPPAPLERRYLTSDATAEKLGEICAANPFGLMVHRDELLSMLSDLDQSDKASARGFFMTGWGGREGYTFDRIQRGTVRVPSVNLSLFGTTQPARLAAYVRDSLRRHDDGMVQRLQLLAWPDFPKEFRAVDRFPDAEARRRAHECYRSLAELNVNEVRAERDDCDGPLAVPFLRFADDAQELFSEWRIALERKLRADDMSSALVAHLAKYRGLVPRLALLCHLAGNGVGPVTLEATYQALEWATYLESHALRLYASTTMDNAEAGRAIWRRVCRGDLSDGFSARDIRRKCYSGLTEQERINAGLKALVEVDWLRPVVLETTGRPVTVYHINPKARDRGKRT